jgi:hypothetical protein
MKRTLPNPIRQAGAALTSIAYRRTGHPARRDCSEYSAGGAPSDAAYDAWINSVSHALGNAKAVVLEEPDALADLSGYCGSGYATDFPGITNTTRIDDISLTDSVTLRAACAAGMMPPTHRRSPAGRAAPAPPSRRSTRCGASRPARSSPTPPPAPGSLSRHSCWPRTRVPRCPYLAPMADRHLRAQAAARPPAIRLSRRR